MRYKNLPIAIGVCHHSTSHMMLDSNDPKQSFFHPTTSFMIESYHLKWVKTAESRSCVQETEIQMLCIFSFI